MALFVPAQALAHSGMSMSYKVKLAAAPDTVDCGQPVTLTATVRPAVPGSMVTLQKHIHSGPWVDVATVPVNTATATAVFTDNPRRHTWYRAIWKISDTCVKQSQVKFVRVRAVVTIQVTPSPYYYYYYYDCIPVTVSGTMIPNNDGRTVRVTICKWDDALGWVMVKSFKALLTTGPDDSSVYAKLTKLPGSGRYRAVVKVSATYRFSSDTGMVEFTL